MAIPNKATVESPEFQRRFLEYLKNPPPIVGYPPMYFAIHPLHARALSTLRYHRAPNSSGDQCVVAIKVSRSSESRRSKRSQRPLR